MQCYAEDWSSHFQWPEAEQALQEANWFCHAGDTILHCPPHFYCVVPLTVQFNTDILDSF